MQKDYVESGVPVIRGGNLASDSRFDGSDFVFVTNEKADELLPNNAHPGDLVFTQRGTLGQIGIIPESSSFPRYLISQSQMKLTVDRQKADPAFIYYVFKAPDTIKRIHNQAFSSGVPHINLEILRSFEIELPEPPVQRRIASILSAYDDLIENNSRRIKILEEMAQMIYREWFVNFRFPGHEKVRMVESELGPIPEGWMAQPLAELLAHVIGGGWGEEEPSDKSTVPAYVIRGTDIPGARNGSIEKSPLRWHKESNFRSRKLEARDLVFEVSGGSKGQPVGRSLLVGKTLLHQFDKDVICASFCKLLRPSKAIGMSLALYLFLTESYSNGTIERYQVQSTGISNFKFTEFISDVRMPTPPLELMERFHDIVIPLMDLVAVLGKRNSNLRTTRDLLLPKLISGEIPVEAADDTAAELMEEAALHA